MTPESIEFASRLRKAFVSLVAAESCLTQATDSFVADYEDKALLKDAWRLAEISANICLRVLEKKDMLVDQESLRE